jgi:hypothetical protein
VSASYNLCLGKPYGELSVIQMKNCHDYFLWGWLLDRVGARNEFVWMQGGTILTFIWHFAKYAKPIKRIKFLFPWKSSVPVNITLLQRECISLIISSSTSFAVFSLWIKYSVISLIRGWRIVKVPEWQFPITVAVLSWKAPKHLLCLLLLQLAIHSESVWRLEFCPLWCD